ncbi:uncharacterized protein [Bemisia tabaci]
MRLCLILTFISWLTLIGETGCVYYVEIRAGAKLDQDNDDRSHQPYVPQLKAGLYICRNVELDMGWKGIWCESVNAAQRQLIYEQATFFTAYRPEFDIGQTIFLDRRDMIEPPTVMSVGFHPNSPDSPGIDAFAHATDKIVEQVEFLRRASCLPLEWDEDVFENFLDYVLCNDVMKCLFNQPDVVIQDMLPAVQDAVRRINWIHEKHLKLKNRVKKAINLLRTMTRSGSDSDEDLPIPSMAQLREFIKLMVNKLLDPCAFLKFTERRADRLRVNSNCRFYCRFFSTATDVFGPNVPLQCTYLVGGTCSQNVCVCEQDVKKDPVYSGKVNMLLCANIFRRKLNRIDLPIDSTLPTRNYSPDSESSSFKEFVSDTDGTPKSNLHPQSKPTPRAQSTPRAQPTPEAKSTPKAQSPPKAQSTHKTQSPPRAQSTPGPQSTPKPQSTPRAKPTPGTINAPKPKRRALYKSLPATSLRTAKKSLKRLTPYLAKAYKYVSDVKLRYSKTQDDETPK